MTKEELDRTRTALINRTLASELTVFNKLDLVMYQLFLKHRLPLNPNPLELQILKFDTQRTLGPLNALLKKLSQSHPVLVLVVFGNPSEDQIKELKKLQNIDVTTVKSLQSITKKYL